MRSSARLVALLALAPALLGLSPFEEAADPAGVARLRDWQGQRFSSADPAGLNQDAGNFLRRDGDLLVLAEADGPGAITRLWATSPAARAGDVFPGEALFFFDGAAAPGLQLPLAALFGGRAPFVPPLSGYWAGGWSSFVPLPFARSVTVAVRGVEAQFYYQVDVARYPPGTPVATFALPLAAADEAALARMATAWSAPPGPFPALAADRDAGGTATLAPGAGAELVTLAGGGVIAALELALDPAEAASLPQLRLRFTWDDAAAPQVDALLADFFAAAHDPATGQVVAYDSLALQVGAGRYRCYLPMPFAAGARLRVENEADRPLAVTLTVRYSAVCPGAALGRLHAQAVAPALVIGADVPLAAVVGRGQLAGLALQIRDCANLECLEGDEHFTVDGAAPLTGTGTEDYFGGGWYFNAGVRRRATATAGNPYLDARTVTAFRFHLTDPVPFAASFAATLEHGGLRAPNTTLGDYRAVTFLYLEGRPDCAPPVAASPATACGCRAAGRPRPEGGAVPGGVLGLAVLLAGVRGARGWRGRATRGTR